MKKVLLLLALFVSVGYSQVIPNSADVKIAGRSLDKTTLYVDCPHVGDSLYTDTGGVNIDTYDYYPRESMRGLLLTGGTGNIGIILAGGGRMVVPITVDDGYTQELFRCFQIKKILTDSVSTFTGRIFPLW